MVRFKNRYVLGRFEWFNTEHIDVSGSGKFGTQGIGSSDIFRALRELVIEIVGQFGFATIQSSLQIKYWNENTGSCILRVARDHASALLSSLVYLKEIKGIPCRWNTLRLSGTIRNCQKVLYTFDKEVMMLKDEDKDEDIIPMEI